MKIYSKLIIPLFLGAFTVLSCEAVVTDVSTRDSITPSTILASHNKSKITPKQLVAEALQIVEENYVDGSFNGLNWQQVKTATLSRPYATSEEAYKAIKSVLNLLENPATRFLTPEQFTAFSGENSGKSHIGVGLLEVLSFDYDERERIRIITPLPDTTAAEVGLQTGDLLTAIDGVSTNNLGLAEAAMKLRGAEGTMVNLTLTRDGSNFDVKLKREKIQLENTVRTQLIDLDDTQIGYIYLGQFLDSSVPEMRDAVNDLQEASALILDLRNNPGGSVLATVEIARFFLGEAKVGTAATRIDLPPLNSTQMQLTEQPLVVLVNRGTASAAELLAGSLQDNRRAIIVGTPTIGKGLIHSPQPLADNSGIIITIGKLFTPNGRDILISGIEPDILSDAIASPLLDPQIEPASSQDIQYLEAVEQLKRMN
ncbi:MAG: S41 family peptidase [Cyanobacteria bacterium P01_A01_bin.83]